MLVLLAIASSSCSLLVGEGFSQDPAPTGPDASPDVTESTGDATPSTTPDATTDATVSDTGASSRYAAAVLADAPIGYWRCGETSGSTLARISRAASGQPASVA